MQLVDIAGTRTLRARANTANALRHSKKGRCASSQSASGSRKQTLFSRFDLQTGGGQFKRDVDMLLAARAAQVFADNSLAAEMRADPLLVLLLLEAPGCATTAALFSAIPPLRDLADRICVPQADPRHFAQMSGVEARCEHQPVASAGPEGGAGGGALARQLRVSHQRLDEWLGANCAAGLRVPLAFLDYETSVYGKRAAELSPLKDLQVGCRGPKP